MRGATCCYHVNTTTPCNRAQNSSRWVSPQVTLSNEVNLQNTMYWVCPHRQSSALASLFINQNMPSIPRAYMQACAQTNLDWALEWQSLSVLNMGKSSPPSMCYSPIHQQVPGAERLFSTASVLWAWTASRRPVSSVDEYCKRYTARLVLACSQGICHLHVDKAGGSRAEFPLCTRCFLGWQKAVCSLTVFIQPLLSSTALWLSKVLVSNITPVKHFITEKTAVT